MSILEERINQVTHNGKYPYFNKELLLEFIEIWLDDYDPKDTVAILKNRLFLKTKQTK